MGVVLGQLPDLTLLFALILGLNLIPAFAPPTWMALALVGFQYHDTSTLLGVPVAKEPKVRFSA